MRSKITRGLLYIIYFFKYLTQGQKRTLTEVEEEDEDEMLPPTPKKALISNSEQNAIKISSISSSVSENLRNKAEKMAQQHIHKLGEAKIGDTVKIEVPAVDRGHADLLHILAYILKIDKSHSIGN